MERIMCSAIWVKDPDKILVHKPRNIDCGIVICGYRHCDCLNIIQLMYDRPTFIKLGHVQGFLTTYKRFVDRVEAKQIATQANQLLDRASFYDELFSEDVW